MNVIFITVSRINDIDDRGIYQDLLREMAKNGNNVYIVSPIEKRYKKGTHLVTYELDDWHKNVKILKIKTGNIQKTNFIEKGISIVTLESKVKRGIKKFLKNIKFDLILYSTPPITIVKPILYLKNKYCAKTYLMLKDIFPQNAIDIGVLSTKGISGIFYHYFKKKENKLYNISDRIGCMSQANIDYILDNNKDIIQEKVELFPNCIEVIDYRIPFEKKIEFREKYNLPIDKKIFVYGGNLGKPQNIDFVIECVNKMKSKSDVYFLIVGSGTEWGKLKNYSDSTLCTNLKLLESLPKNDYDEMIASCDYGLIFLDYRFTIPNYPSRLLSYMQAGLPILACTDTNTDIGKYIEDNNLGVWCSSNDANNFSKAIDTILNKNYDDKLGIEKLKIDFDVKKWSKKLEEFAK